MHISVQIPIIALSINYILLTWGFLYNQFLKLGQVLILSSLLLLAIIGTFISSTPYFFSCLILFYFLQLLFIEKNLKNWLIPSILATIEWTVLILVWLISFDIPIFIRSNPNLFSHKLFLLLLIQTALIIFFIYIIHVLDQKYELSHSFLSLRKKNYISGISLFLSLTILIYFHMETAIQGLGANFLISTILFLVLSLSTSSTIILINKSYRDAEFIKHLSLIMKTEEKNYHLAREFKHDLSAILISLQGYLQENNLKQATQYIDMLTQQAEKNQPNIYYKEIIQIHNEALRNLIFHFAHQLEEKNIPFRLKIEDFNSNPLNINIIDFVRCVSIMLTNALEASLKEECPLVELALYHSVTTLELSVRNNVTHAPDLNLIFKKNYSTNSGKRGIGLFTFRKIIGSYTNCSYNVSVSQNQFELTFMIENSCHE